MQSIQSILDSKLSLGFSYFYGLGDDEGYLRRLLHNNPSLTTIYSILRDDIEFVSSADESYFRNRTQLKSFKKLKKYLEEAKKYVKLQMKKKEKHSKSEQSEIQSEIKELDKDFRNGMIEEEDYNYAIKMLLKPTSDDLSEVKSMFEKIDSKVKRELKKVGYEEENLDFTDADEEDYYREFAQPREEVAFDINKLVDEKNRRYTMEEFNDIYEDINSQQTALKNQITKDPIAKRNNVAQMKLRNDRIKNLISKKKIPTNMNRAQLDKLTDEQLAGLENT